jgi:hypothetical protein
LVYRGQGIQSGLNKAAIAGEWIATTSSLLAAVDDDVDYCLVTVGLLARVWVLACR